MPPRSTRFIRILFCLLCVFSGMSSLVYETLWIRVLSLGIGSTSASMSMVLSIFFLGLSLGSYFAGRWSHRVRNPWLAYGVLEGIIGLYGALVIFILFRFNSLLGIFSFVDMAGISGTFLKSTLVFIFLILPSFCMGATLPLLVKASGPIFAVPGRAVSLLYGLNTLGAVFGAVLTGFFLIPTLGILGSNWLSAILNFAVFGATWLYRNRILATGEKMEATPPSDASPPPKPRSPMDRSVLIITAACGFSAVAAEVVWTKYLSIFLGTNIFGLALVLALYLLGIALGSLGVALFVNKIRAPHWVLGILTALVLLALFGASRALNFAPVAANVAAYYLGEGMSLLAIKCIVTFLVLFVPTCLFGAIFPLCVQILSKNQNSAHEASVLGTAYSLNTIGSILGSCIAGLVVIPLWGSSAALQVAMLALGLALAWYIWPLLQKRLQRFAWGGVTVLAGAVIFSSDQVSFRNIITSAYYQAADPNLSLVDAVRYFSKGYEEFKLIYEGKSGVISLSHDPQDGAEYKQYLRLKTSGLNESVYDLRNLETLPKYEALLGFLPYTLVRHPQSAFLVGYGGGYTTDFLTRTRLKEVHVVELEEGVLKAAEVVYQGADTIYRGKNPIVERPNLRLEIQDARYVLTTQAGKNYDMILSQPSHSWLSGVANLFTLEFFKIVRSRLTPHGVFSQWLNLYNMDPAGLKSILRTFYEVFPYGAVFTQPGDQELIMIGALQPVSFNMRKLELIGQDRKIQAQLAHLSFSNGYDLLAQVALSREDALRISEGAPINSDVNAYAEVEQTRIFYRPKGAEGDPSAFLERAYTGNLASIAPIPAGGEPEFYEGILASLATQRKYSRMITVLGLFEKAIENAGMATPDRLARLGHWCLQAERYQSAIKYLERSLALQPNARAFQLLMGAYVSVKNFQTVAVLVARPKMQAFSSDGTRCTLAHAVLQTRGVEVAKTLFRPILLSQERYLTSCGAYYNKVVGAYWIAQNRFKDAIPYLEAYYKAYTQDPQVVADLVTAYLRVGDWANGREFSGYLPTSLDQAKGHRKQMAENFEKQGLKEDAQAMSAMEP